MTITAENTTEKRDVYPVFRGLSELGVGDADLARAMETTPAVVAAWRSGEARMPARLVAFLTLFLDALVDQMGLETTIRPATVLDGSRDAIDSRLMRARDGLHQQQAFNCGFDRRHLEDGLRLFLTWRNRTLYSGRWGGAAERTQAVELGVVGT